MINVTDKKKCSGCTACYNVCPVDAITMEKDDEGFLYPKVNKDKCIKCGLCTKICPFINKLDKHADNVKIFNAHTKDNDLLNKTSSGGIFPEIAKKILNEKGVIVAVDKNNQYKIVEDIKNLETLYGSKYVQVFPNRLFRDIKNLLDKEKVVLFVGTPCYINGLKRYLNKDYDNLYTCDLICHGVPSERWLEIYKESFNKNVEYLDYREKSHGWKDFSVKVNFKKGYQKSLATDNEYMRAFLNNYCLRPSCYSCKAKGNNRLADITLGDYWEISNQNKNYNYNGNSLVIVNNDKGKLLFDKIKENINWNCETKEAVDKNTAYAKSVSEPIERNCFYSDLNKMSYKKVVKKYKLSPEWKRKIKIKIKNIFGVE